MAIVDEEALLKIPIEWGCRFHSIRQQDGTNHRVLPPPQPHPLVFVTSSSSFLTLQLDARKKLAIGRDDQTMIGSGWFLFSALCLLGYIL